MSNGFYVVNPKFSVARFGRTFSVFMNCLMANQLGSILQTGSPELKQIGKVLAQLTPNPVGSAVVSPNIAVSAVQSEVCLLCSYPVAENLLELLENNEERLEAQRLEVPRHLFALADRLSNFLDPEPEACSTTERRINQNAAENLQRMFP